jgi:L-seryl-tRNA(Ser) seleniumtransferase
MTAQSPYRALPSVHRLAADPRLRPLRDDAPPEVVAQLVREVLAEARQAIARGRPAPSREQLAEAVLHRAGAVLRPSLRPVINATGVIVHTNLGRAPLSQEAIAAMEAVARGYSNLELDLEAGERGSRHVHLEGLLCRLTGAEAALAVNNNAAAVLLALTALCQGREVVVSRGQAVEIGGGFRIPDILRQSGARLVEVGTTNRTYLQDYEAAIGPETAALLRVHASNFRIVGFTHSVPLREMAQLAHARGLVVIDDLGSGCLLDTTPFGLAHEPMPQESLRDGADLVCFSGDKLLGGPQAGIVLGRRELVERLRRHPLARAVRLDKASTAALQATLLHYLRGEALAKVPVWQMIATPLRELERRARRWARALGPPAQVRPSRSMVGGGSLPEEGLPTRVLALPGEGAWLLEVARRLRLGEPPVVGRIEADALLLDPRTVDPRHDPLLVAALRAALARP